VGRKAKPLTVEQILVWADAHRVRTGERPTAASGPVMDAPGERWRAIEAALWFGNRGLPGRDSLARLLDRHRRAWEHRRLSWEPEEDALVSALPPTEAAHRTGRTLAAVYQRRGRLGISRARRGT
jgi:hypothetical protein